MSFLSLTLDEDKVSVDEHSNMMINQSKKINREQII